MENIQLTVGLAGWALIILVVSVLLICLLQVILTHAHKQHEINLREAMNGDFSALCELVNEYMAGEDKKYFKKYPQHAVDVFNAAKKLVEIVESRNGEKNPELEDYYWLGMMYEEGFGTEKNLDKAREYYQKALTTTECWCGDAECYQSQRAEIEQRLKTLN